MWAAENVIGVIDVVTGQVVEERRTNVTYGWTSDQAGFQLVFEFRKLTQKARSRTAYVGPSGMERFVTGIYSKAQLVAAMVGMMIDPSANVVPPLVQTLEATDSISALKSNVVAGKVCQSPSTLFGEAEFDTEHARSSGKPIRTTISVTEFPLFQEVRRIVGFLLVR